MVPKIKEYNTSDKNSKNVCSMWFNIVYEQNEIIYNILIWSVVEIRYFVDYEQF